MNDKIKIFGILALAFFFMRLLSGTVFLSNSPRLNSSFFLALKNKTFNFLASLSVKSKVNGTANAALKSLEQLPSSTLRSVGTGVYAKEDTSSDVIYIRIDKNAEWEEKIISLDGRQIKIRVPKGTFK